MALIAASLHYVTLLEPCNLKWKGIFFSEERKVIGVDTLEI